jgi:mannan endo-1,4-beta-mannosidase
MNKIYFLMASLIVSMGLSAANATPARQLIKRLADLQNRGIMVGHQDDPVYGTTWKWDSGRSDVKDVCGDYPAVMGFELGALELDSTKNLDGVPFSRIRQEIVAQYKRGGIITLSWHPYNPVTGKNAWDPSGTPLKEILSGGAVHAKFESWIGKVAAFIKSLKTVKGNRIPVIFRPWHEMTGGWFWWGCKSCTPEEYKSIYRYTIDRLHSLGVDNAVICYSPGADSNETAERYMTYYPGDKYVDMLGVDAYQYGSKEQYVKDVRNELAIMQQLSAAHKKLYALTETGYRNTPDAEWFTTGVLPAISGFRMSYVLFWRNAWDQKEENFGPAPDKSCAGDFRKFYADKSTLFVKDIKGKTHKGK